MRDQTRIVLDQLASQACPDGGWGYAPGQAGHLEPTCLALLALAGERERYAAVIETARAFLKSCAGPDGLYRLGRGRPEAVWPSSLVLFVQTSLDEPAEEVNRTASALLGLRGRDVSQDDSDINDIDSKLIGWPWAEQNFSWVEPTCWAVLALRRAGQGNQPRVAEGVRLLLDRALEEGGINYGNRRILGIALEPIPGPTALMLLALQGQPSHPRIASSVSYLRSRGIHEDDLEHLCWSRLALDLYQDHEGVREALVVLDQRIRTAHEVRATVPWLRPAPLRLALTALALSTDRNPFRLPAEASAPLTPRERKPSKPGLGQRLKTWFDGMKIEAINMLQPLESQTAVHIAPAGDYNADLADVLRRQYENFRQRVPLKGKRVVLKPNLVEYHRDKVINTHPNVVAAVIELCRREEAAEVLVAEGPGHWRNVEYLVSASGLGDVLNHYKVPFVDLNHDEPSQANEPGPADRAGTPLPVADHRHRGRGDLAAEAEDASLGGGHAVAEEPVRHLAGHLLRLAQERTALARHRQQHRGHCPDAHARPGHRRWHHRHGRRRPAERPPQTDGRAGDGLRPGGGGRDLLPADEAGPAQGRLPGAGQPQEAGSAPREPDPATGRNRRWAGQALCHGGAFREGADARVTLSTVGTSAEDCWGRSSSNRFWRVS